MDSKNFIKNPNIALTQLNCNNKAVLFFLWNPPLGNY